MGNRSIASFILSKPLSLACRKVWRITSALVGNCQSSSGISPMIYLIIDAQLPIPCRLGQCSAEWGGCRFRKRSWCVASCPMLEQPLLMTTHDEPSKQGTYAYPHRVQLVALLPAIMYRLQFECQTLSIRPSTPLRV